MVDLSNPFFTFQVYDAWKIHPFNPGEGTGGYKFKPDTSNAKNQDLD